MMCMTIFLFSRFSHSFYYLTETFQAFKCALLLFHAYGGLLSIQKNTKLTRRYVAVRLETTSVTKSKGNRVFCVQVCRRKVEKYKVACACEASQHHLCVHLSATVLSPSHTHRAVDFICLLNCLYREYYNPEEQLAALNISEYAFSLCYFQNSFYEGRVQAHRRWCVLTL